MGSWSRVSAIFKAKANKAIDRMEDPRQTLDYAYQRKTEMLRKVRRSLLDVATARKRLELQGQALQARAAKLHQQAKRAMEAGREDLAREALTRRAAIEPELDSLKAQHTQIQVEEQKLAEASTRLSAQLDALRARKETIKAGYTAAEARAKAGEALSGLAEEMGDIGATVQRAEHRTVTLQARAAAIDELLASGALDDPATARPTFDAELGRAVAQTQIDAELARLKAELAPPGRREEPPDRPS